MPPRVVIAAPSSGSGKTTITTGLLGALAARGTVPAPFKIGPDYVDPGYHALAAGRPGRNLDPVLCGVDRLAPLVAHGATGAALAVVEGVMGLFDGRLAPGGWSGDSKASLLAPSDSNDAFLPPERSRPDDGSTAHVARVLEAPVVLVVDARGQHRSIAALLHGFRTFDPAVAPAGVILNRVGTERHADALRAACAEVGVPVLGVVPRRAELAVPSRHLGLITAAEHGADARAAVDAMTALVAAHVDLDAVERLARSAPATPVEAWDPVLEVGPTDRRARRVVAVAGGPAFTFGYPEHAELLQAAGGEVVVVDPLRDEALPERTAGLVLPGGFPEEHLEDLSANVALRSAVEAFATAGGAVHAECGGLLYLGRSLDGSPMCGVLDADAAMGPRLTLGYRTATAVADSPVAAAGETVTGHEFHRTVTTPRAGSTPAWSWDDTTEGFVQGSVHASYLHTHPAGRPEAVRRFVAGLVGPP
ncbi:cobyrinate a,c-diamide synthase [Actinomycetospora soli]|uniref:cobyrinate a,c-diamide synthase n=1 Tax=Actinomycetospora soli TaxID=2893887 RepID=UPI001E60F5FA|nr:cobyrinate a,c-diamide synthase [Actinomycetospora soli]MCD2189619.1 cobyrinate a,c-diamide synthase [Actinomycetospora soli]